MRSTPETEAAEIEAARLDVKNSQRDLALAQHAALGAPILSPLADAEDDQWVRVALAQRRERDATDASTRGERRRHRLARFGRIFGMRSPPTPDVPADRPGVRAATVRFLDEQLDHDSAEDLHPARLDEAEADLDNALARASLAKTNAERDARDA
jgi:hypothetical protein